MTEVFFEIFLSDHLIVNIFLANLGLAYKCEKLYNKLRIITDVESNSEKFRNLKNFLVDKNITLFVTDS